MIDLLTQVEKYIHSKETLKFVISMEMPGVDREQDKSMKKKYKEDKSNKFYKRLRLDRRESKLLPLRYNNCTPLNTACTNIFIEIQDRNIINWLSKLRGNPNLRDRKKYCYFYRDYGHDTKECKTLKDEIKALIEGGYLSKYKGKYRVEKPTKQERAKKKPSV